MRLTVEFLPANELRYNTAGDYFIDSDGALRFQIARSGNQVYDQLVLIHEMVEELIVRCQGVPLHSIDKFDMEFDGDGEPGDEPDCPYRIAHCYATAVERMLVATIGADWKAYDGATSTDCARGVK